MTRENSFGSVSQKSTAFFTRLGYNRVQVLITARPMFLVSVSWCDTGVLGRPLEAGWESHSFAMAGRFLIEGSSEGIMGIYGRSKSHDLLKAGGSSSCLDKLLSCLDK